MGLPSGVAGDAGHRHGAHRADDPHPPAAGLGGRGRRLRRSLIALAVALAAPAEAQPLRIATWHADLSRQGPGLLLHELTGRPRASTLAAVQVIAALDADALLLTDIDWDAEGRTLAALAALLAQAGVDYPHLFALRPNRGMPTGLDLDGNGSLGEPEDAQGFGPYPGWGGMAILSRLPVAEAEVRDFSALLWADLPGAAMPPDTPAEVRAVQRLASSGLWEVPLVLPDGGRLRLLAFHAAVPLGERGLRRNHDEMAFWLHLFDGTLAAPPAPPFVLLGDANADPADGDARTGAILDLLNHPELQDPRPAGNHGRTEPAHRGDPAIDTVDYGTARGMPGALRVDYVLPWAGLKVTAKGVMWPPEDDPLAAVLARASRHRPVWVEIALP